MRAGLYLKKLSAYFHGNVEFLMVKSHEVELAETFFFDLCDTYCNCSAAVQFPMYIYYKLICM
jgi:hypothetical protein